MFKKNSEFLSKYFRIVFSASDKCLLRSAILAKSLLIPSQDFSVLALLTFCIHESFVVGVALHIVGC